MAEMEEKLSAMFDGDVDESTARALFSRLKRDAAFRGEWDAFCLVGDVIRGGFQPKMEGFVARVMSRLDDEPTVLAPRQTRSGDAPRSIYHRLFPVAASVMGVLAVGGVVAALYGGDPGAATTPAVPPAVASAAPDNAPPVVSPAVLPVVGVDIAHRDYLVAHQAMAGGPMPAAVQYVRTVSAPAEE